MATLHNTAHTPKPKQATAIFDLSLERLRFLISAMERKMGCMSSLRTNISEHHNGHSVVSGFAQEVMLVIGEVADQGDDSLIRFQRG